MTDLESLDPYGPEVDAMLVDFRAAAQGRKAEGAARTGRRDEDIPLPPEPPEDGSERLPSASPNSVAPTGRRARITWGSDMEPEPAVWAWEDDGSELPSDALGKLKVPLPFGRIPAGTLAIAAGREGTGKSSFGIWMTSRITRGTLPGSFYGTPRNVFYVAVEDSWKHVLLPRTIATGVDRGRIGRFDVVIDEDTEMTLSLPADIALLEAEMLRHEVALVVIDPLMSTIGENIDTHRERDTRTALDPLARLAERTGAVILGIAHFNKSGGKDASSLITGSGAFKNVARAVFAFAHDDDGSRVMTQEKNSYGRSARDLPSMVYDITEAIVETKKGEARVGRFSFTGMADRSVSEVLGGSLEGYTRKDAEVWLTDFLDDRGGYAPSADVKDAAGKVPGLSEKTLHKARRSLKVTSARVGFPAITIWILPGVSVVPSGAARDGGLDSATTGTTVGTTGAGAAGMYYSRGFPICDRATAQRDAMPVGCGYIV